MTVWVGDGYLGSPDHAPFNGIIVAAAPEEKTARGIPYRGLSDADMLKSQLALLPGDRKPERIEFLKSGQQSSQLT